MPAADPEVRPYARPPERDILFPRPKPALKRPTTAQRLVAVGRSLASRFNRPRWRLALHVIVSVALLALLLAKVHIDTFLGVLLHIDPLLAVLGLYVGVVTIILSAWQWQIVLKQEGFRLRLSLLTGLYFVGHTFSQLLPSSIGGDVAMAAYIGRFSRRGVEAASGTLMARVIGLSAMLATAIPVAIVASLTVPGLGWSLTLLLLGAAAAYIGCLALLLYSPRLLSRVGASRLARYRFGRKVLELADTVAQYRKRPGGFARASLASLIFYCASNLNFYCYGLALHLRSPFWFYWIAIPLTALATMLPISLNGYGVRGASFVLVFAFVGEPAAAALSLSLVSEIQRLIFALVGGCVLPVLNHTMKKDQTASQQPAFLPAETLRTEG
jgi:glycosyltransferase 2 family protein